MKKIGTVEVLSVRVYPLDGANDGPHATEVVVEPGKYDLYSDGLSYFWMMTGRVNVGRMRRLGDGIFTMAPYDIPEGPEVTFPSRVYGPDEWAAFIASPACIEGHEHQRLRIRLAEHSPTT